MTKKNMKALKDLLVMDNETLNSIAPKPFKPCSLSVILSALAPYCYSQEQLAQIKSFSELSGADTATVAVQSEDSIRRVTKKPRSKRMKRVAATKKVKKSKRNATPPSSNVLSADIPSSSSSSNDAPPQVLPLEFKNRIIELSGTDVAFIMHKTICATDTARNNNRLSMPLRQMECDFLTEAEKEALDERDKKKGKSLIGLEVRVLDPCLREWKSLKLKKWEMNTGFVYNLVADWNNLCRSNSLQVGDKLNVWTFRVQDKRYFMLHKLI